MHRQIKENNPNSGAWSLIKRNKEPIMIHRQKVIVNPLNRIRISHLPDQFVVYVYFISRKNFRKKQRPVLFFVRQDNEHTISSAPIRALPCIIQFHAAIFTYGSIATVIGFLFNILWRQKLPGKILPFPGEKIKIITAVVLVRVQYAMEIQKSRPLSSANRY